MAGLVIMRSSVMIEAPVMVATYRRSQPFLGEAKPLRYPLQGSDPGHHYRRALFSRAALVAGGVFFSGPF